MSASAVAAAESTLAGARVDGSGDSPSSSGGTNTPPP